MMDGDAPARRVRKDVRGPVTAGLPAGPRLLAERMPVEIFW